MRHLKTAARILALFAWLLTACSATETSPEAIAVSGGSYMEVTAPTLNDMLAQKDFVFVNVHIPFAGNIAKTDLSIPYDQIEESLSQLPADKNARIILYCRSGRMSTIAAEKLVEFGYTNVWHLKGGMVDWENAGYPLEP